MLSRDQFSNYLKQYDEKNLFSANCFIQVPTENMVKESKFKDVEYMLQSRESSWGFPSTL